MRGDKGARRGGEGVKRVDMGAKKGEEVPKRVH